MALIVNDLSSTSCRCSVVKRGAFSVVIRQVQIFTHIPIQFLDLDSVLMLQNAKLMLQFSTFMLSDVSAYGTN